MTLVVLIVSAVIAAWAHEAREAGHRMHQAGLRIAAHSIEIAFAGIAIGAGIQLLFRG